MIKVVVFDLDDTLTPEHQFIYGGFKCVSLIIARDYSLNEIDVFDRMMKLFKDNTKNVFNALLDSYNITTGKAYIDKLVDAYRNHEPQIEYFDDVIPTLKQLKALGYKLAIISDGYLNSQQNKIDKLQVNALFDKVVLTDSLGKKYWKPNTRGFEIIKKHFHVTYTQMVYVGDNPNKDFCFSKTIGVKTIRIYRENAIYEFCKYFDDIRENYSITNLYTLVEILNSM